MTPKRNKKRAVFLDRDGVINVSPGGGFVTDWKQFRFLPGVPKALRILKERRWMVIVVSNQSGVGRGIMTKGKLEEITWQMQEAVSQAGGRINAVYYCIHHPEDDCSCRKPKIGLLKRAARKFSIDLKRSFVIGDDERDILMGHRAGCCTVLVLSGKQTRRTIKRLSVSPHRVASTLLQAVRWIVSSDRR